MSVGLLVALAAIGLLGVYGIVRRRRQQQALVKDLGERELRLKLALWGSGDGFWDWHVTSNELHREGLDRVLGIAESSVVIDLEDWKTGQVHPDDLQAVNDRIYRHINGQTEYYQSEHRLRAPNGSWVWVLARGKVVERDAEGKAMRVAGTVRNIEDERRRRHDARVAGEVIRSMAEAVAVLDEQCRFRQVNPAFEQASGYAAIDLLGQPWSMLESPRNAATLLAARDEAMAAGRRWRGDLWQRGRGGVELLFATNLVQARDRDAEAPYYVMVQNDITARYRSEQELRFLANYDPLTGLANRTMLMQRVAAALAEAQQLGRRLALLFMDLDRFKQINDSLGHTVGDELLKAVGERLRGSLPANAFLGRQGGDEFTILLGEPCASEDCEKLARGLLQAFSEPVLVRGNEVPVTPSIGIAQYPEHADNPADLLRFADGAMYAAKAAGRNAFRFFHHEMASGSRLSVALEQSARLGEGLARISHTTPAADAARLEEKWRVVARSAPADRLDVEQTTPSPLSGPRTAPRHALGALATDRHEKWGLGDFRLHYQPIYCLRTRKPLAVEALLRWAHPELGEIGPEIFVPLLEESGSIVRVGRQVVREALRQVGCWRADGLPELKVAVNLSTLQLLRSELAADIRAALAESGLPGEVLELELTETLLMSNPEQAIRTLADLKALGVSIAVDDFGTGYSSLSYLKRLPIDKLKIDREFIGDLLHDPDDAVIVETILAMARALNLRATGEGVEDPGQLSFLADKGCEEVQGFLLCRPLPAVDCEAVLKRGLTAAAPAS